MKIPYGNANFAEIREKGLFYVDKTPFLPELESHEFGYSNLIFHRPRRFGKSLLISLLEHYYIKRTRAISTNSFEGFGCTTIRRPRKTNTSCSGLTFRSLGSSGRRNSSITASLK